MTDDRFGPEPMDELGELLSLADRAVRFPEPGRSDLLDRVIRTASMPRAERADVVPLVADERISRPPRRTWVAGIAASLIVIVVTALAVVVGQEDGAQPPADDMLPAPVTVDQACAALPPLAAANGLGQGSVQLGDVSLDDLGEVRRLLAAFSVDSGDTALVGLVDDAITRVRLLEISIEASSDDAALNAMTAARASVGAVIDEAC